MAKMNLARRSNASFAAIVIMSIQSRDVFLEYFFSPGGIVDQKVNEGATDEDLASQYNVSPETIRNWFLRTGLRRRPRARLSQLNMARILEFEAAGFSDEDILRQVFSGSIRMDMIEQARSTMDLEEAQQLIQRNANQFAPKLPRRRKKKRIKDPEGRHERRSHWTPEQKQQVIELLTAEVAPYEIWKITGASKRRQRMIAREFGVSV